MKFSCRPLRAKAHSFVEEGIFLKDNYDFLPVIGPAIAVIFRRNAWLNPNYRTIGEPHETMGHVNRHVPEPQCEELNGEEAIFAATKEYRPLIAQTEIWNESTNLRAIIEYPIKTMNTVSASQFEPLAAIVHNPLDISGKNSLYQTDTGPVAFPDLSERKSRHAELLWLAFVAFNATDAAEFIIEKPVAIGGTKTRHYTRRVRLPAKNRLFGNEAVRGKTC